VSPMTGPKGGHRGGGSGDMDPTEFFAGIHAALFLIPVAGVLVLGVVADWAQWAVDHGVLAAASENPLVALPLADGAGLDMRRLVILSVALIALIVAVTAFVRPLLYRSRLKAMRRGDMS